MLLHTLSRKVYSQRMSFWLPFRHFTFAQSCSMGVSSSQASRSNRRSKKALGSVDFSEQVFDKSELQDILMARLEKIRDEGSGYEA